jgi:hypothetical protein
MRISHLVIRENAEETVVASKMLYASHYFWTALELRVLVSDPSRGTGFWFVTVNSRRFERFLRPPYSQPYPTGSAKGRLGLSDGNQKETGTTCPMSSLLWHSAVHNGTAPPSISDKIVIWISELLVLGKWGQAWDVFGQSTAIT